MTLPSRQFLIPVSGYHYPPPSAQYQMWQSSFSDSSGPLFAMYLRIVEEQDQKRVERLKADAEQILIFVSHSVSYRYATIACLL